MSSLSESELINVVIGWIKDNKLKNGSANVVVSPDTNLLERGVLDSLGFVELILFLEGQTGSQVSLFDVDPAEFTHIRGLCKVALRNHE